MRRHIHNFNAKHFSRKRCIFSHFPLLLYINRSPTLRNEAQVIMSTLDSTDQIVGKSMGQKRARKLMESKKAELIKLDGVIRAESVKATELLLPYMDKLKAQTIAYAHGYKRPIADAKVSVFFNVEQNSAYLAYQQMNAITDTAVHSPRTLHSTW